MRCRKILPQDGPQTRDKNPIESWKCDPILLYAGHILIDILSNINFNFINERMLNIKVWLIKEKDHVGNYDI